MKLDKNKKYLFVVSDIHSFATELKSSLRKAGFNKKNPNHTLIVCGDVFDRGEETVAVYKYLSSIPKSRCILIRGNHEDLYNELLTKDFPQRHDFSNGTVSTMCAIAGADENMLSPYYWFDSQEDLFNKQDAWDTVEKLEKDAWANIVEDVKNSEITAWLNSDQWCNYYETDKFIFVHSFIPTKLEGLKLEYINIGKIPMDCYKYDKNWREAEDWFDARWGCPWKLYKAGLFKKEEANGKTLVVGHWHTSAFFENLKNAYGQEGKIYFSKGLIGIDGGVRNSWFGLIHEQNVLVIDEDNVCYNERGEKLVEIKEIPVIETVSVGE